MSSSRYRWRTARFPLLGHNHSIRHTAGSPVTRCVQIGNQINMPKRAIHSVHCVNLHFNLVGHDAIH
eukprot:116602-Amphidinium_carterae.1